MMRRLTLPACRLCLVSAPSRAVGKPDLAALRAEYERSATSWRVRGARAQLVKEAITPRKLSASFRWQGSPRLPDPSRRARLDGGDLWNSGDKPLAGDLIKVAERGIKPDLTR